MLEFGGVVSTLRTFTKTVHPLGHVAGMGWSVGIGEERAVWKQEVGLSSGLMMWNQHSAARQRNDFGSAWGPGIGTSPVHSHSQNALGVLLKLMIWALESLGNEA
jgi:hypothetical protein